MMSGVSMNKKYIIRKNEEIQEIIKKSRKVNNRYYIIYYFHNDLKHDRYCVSVSKKIGKAYLRNLYKRRIKDILMKFNIDKSNDYVIILRKSVLEINFDKMKDELISLIKEINDEKEHN